MTFSGFLRKIASDWNFSLLSQVHLWALRYRFLILSFLNDDLPLSVIASFVLVFSLLIEDEYQARLTWISVCTDAPSERVSGLRELIPPTSLCRQARIFSAARSRNVEYLHRISEGYFSVYSTFSTHSRQACIDELVAASQSLSLLLDSKMHLPSFTPSLP